MMKQQEEKRIEKFLKEHLTHKLIRSQYFSNNFQLQRKKLIWFKIRQEMSLICINQLILFKKPSVFLQIKSLKKQINNPYQPQSREKLVSSQKIKTDSEEYLKLEQQIQKHESELRIHKRVNQCFDYDLLKTIEQLRLYSESLQEQLEESELTRKNFISETTKLIQRVQKENSQLSENIKATNAENMKLKEKIAAITVNQNEFSQKVSMIPEMKSQIKDLFDQIDKNQVFKTARAQKAVSGSKKQQTQYYIKSGKESSQSKINQSTDCQMTSQIQTSGSTPLKRKKTLRDAQDKVKDKEIKPQSKTRPQRPQDYRNIQKQQNNVNFFDNVRKQLHFLNEKRCAPNKSQSANVSKQTSQNTSINLGVRKFSDAKGKRNWSGQRDVFEEKQQTYRKLVNYQNKFK